MRRNGVSDTGVFCDWLRKIWPQGQGLKGPGAGWVVRHKISWVNSWDEDGEDWVLWNPTLSPVIGWIWKQDCRSEEPGCTITAGTSPTGTPLLVSSFRAGWVAHTFTVGSSLTWNHAWRGLQVRADLTLIWDSKTLSSFPGSVLHQL